MSGQTSGKILIVDDLVTNRIILKVKLNAASHEVLQAASAAEALEAARRERPRLILLDMVLPDLSGIEVCRILRTDPQTRHIPIILISASTRREDRLSALAAGADDFLSKPLDEALLMARIRCLLRLSQAESDLRQRAETCRAFGLSEAAAEFGHPSRVALVAADAGQAVLWQRMLAAHLPGHYRMLTASQALAGATGAEGPDLYVIAADLGRPGDCLRLIADLRARCGAQEVGLCLAMADPAQEVAALALDLGATDLVPLPRDPEETALRLRLQLDRQRHARALRKAISQGLELAAIDPLTGLYNRRYALAELDRVAARAAASGTRYAVMVLDIDRFKLINDRFGHAAGDSVLATVAARLAGALAAPGLLARIGGEEFLAVLPDTTLESAREAAEALCRSVSDSPVPLPDGMGAVAVTLSAGLSMAPSQGGTGLSPSAARLAGPAPVRPALRPQEHRPPVPPDPDRFTDRSRGPAAAPAPGMLFDRIDLGHTAAVGQVPIRPAAIVDPGPTAPGNTLSRPLAASVARPARTQPEGATETPPPPGWPIPEVARAVLALADAALLAAKAEGRNQITVSSAA